MPGPRPGPATCAAAWRVQPSTKIAATSSSDRSASSSRSTLQSTVARRVRWRSGRSTAPVPNASSEVASRSRSAAGVQDPAARRRQLDRQRQPVQPPAQISATARALVSSRAKAGSAARARWTKRSIAGHADQIGEAAAAPVRVDRARAVGPGRPARRRRRSTTRLVASRRSAGQAARRSTRGAVRRRPPAPGCPGPAASCRSPPQPARQASSGALAPRVDARFQRGGDGRQDEVGVADRGQRDEHDARSEAVTQAFGHGHRQAGLADPARPAEGHQPGPVQQPPDLGDLLLPAHQRGELHRQVVEPGVQRPRRREVGRRGPRSPGRGGARAGRCPSAGARPGPRKDTPSGRACATSPRVASETRTLPPWPAAAIRAARFTSRPT